MNVMAECEAEVELPQRRLGVKEQPNGENVNAVWLDSELFYELCKSWLPSKRIMVLFFCQRAEHSYPTALSSKLNNNLCL